MSFIIDPYRFNTCPAEALAFIAAAGITDTTQKQAICKLVSDLQGYGIWNKMKAIYPMVGGTSTTCKYNLKDPRDLDAAYRLVFFGGWTFSNTGALPNGTNGYADTFFNPSVSFSNNNLHLSYYVRTYTANVNGKVLIGAGQSSNTTGTIMNWSTPSNPPFYYPTLQEWSFPAIPTFPTKITGLHIGRRIDASNQTLFINNVKYNSAQSSNNKLPNNKISLGSNKDVNYQQYVDCQCAFASIGDGLTDTEAANLYTAVQAYQTTLGRQV